MCFLMYVVRLRDPTNDEPRLLKLKDWPPGADFSEKLPRRYVCICVVDAPYSVDLTTPHVHTYV